MSHQKTYAQITYPDRMYADSLHAPFHFGVASAAPSSTELVLWTKVDSDMPTEVQYELSLTEDFLQLEAQGAQSTSPDLDMTIHVPLSGLAEDTYYYYRFIDDQGKYSAVGRSKTLPSNPEDLKLAAASCASVYSGYFNAYRQLAQIEDLDLMIHLGDYIYNDPDGDELIRVPDPYPVDPSTLEEWRERHEYYLLDPDLREARQMHPWIVLWDNHDMGNKDDVDDWAGSVQAFHEYIPGSRQLESDPFQIYRKISVGNLVDLFVVDLHTYKGDDIIIDEETSILGNQQYEWLTEEMNSSEAKWKILANQNIMGHWNAVGIPTIIDYPTDGDVFDDTTWDGHFEDRKRLFQFWRENEIDNILVLSGDAHLSFANDLIIPPIDESGYDRATGEGAHGVEMVITSITRGNFDEEGYNVTIAEFAADVSQSVNPHHLYNNFHEHGYCLVHVAQDSVLVDFWSFPITEVSDDFHLDQQMILLEGTNRWERTQQITLIEEIDQSLIKVYPNPTSQQVLVNTDWITGQEAYWELHTTAGALLQKGKLNRTTAADFSIPLPDTDQSLLILSLTDRDRRYSLKLRVEN